MGVINVSQEDLSMGLSISNLYYCLGDQMIYLQRFKDNSGNEPVTKYRYHCSFEVYASYQAKQDNKQYIKTLYVEAIVDNNQVDAYTLMYNKLKEQVSNYVDVL